MFHTGACLVALISAAAPGTDLRVSSDGHRIERGGGRFFYLADTAWELFARTTRAEAVRYLDDRQAKGFTVIQTAFLALHQGANAYGHTPARYPSLTPLTTPGADPADRAAYDYWDHVDFVLDQAARRGFHVAVAPFRQQLLPKRSGDAERYARFLGARYGRRPNLIWVVGFDPSPEQIEARIDAYRAVARGLAVGAGGGESRLFMTFHPAGRNSSARWFHRDPWLRCNMTQSGHGRDTPSWELIATDYARSPAKPVLDAEPTYEDHPLAGTPRDPRTGARPLSDAADVRNYAYWNLLAGACGHAYGHHSVWQMYRPDRGDEGYGAKLDWTEALDAPGASQMRHVRTLFESRPAALAPDQTLVKGSPGGAGHIQAGRGDGTALVYAAEGGSFTVVLGKVSGQNARASWFDPRTGQSRDAGTFPNRGTRRFDSPGRGRGHDWVLILDDAAKNFPPPVIHD